MRFTYSSGKFNVRYDDDDDNDDDDDDNYDHDNDHDQDNHGRMARGGHGLHKVSPGPNPNPETALRPLQGWPAYKAGGPQAFSTHLDTPHCTPKTITTTIRYQVLVQIYLLASATVRQTMSTSNIID
jgi:hypothetical protein